MRRNSIFLLAFLFNLGSTLSFAAESVRVLDINSVRSEVTLSFDPYTRWAPNDTVCGFAKGRRIFCGRVTQALSTRTTVKLDEKPEGFGRGTILSLRMIQRRVATQSSQDVVEHSQEQKTHDISVGLAAGFNYFFPIVQLQQGLGANFSIGIEPMYVNFSEGNASVKAYGGFLTGSYYITHFPFRGFYLQEGIGLYAITATQGAASSQNTQPALMSTIQWRGLANWDLGLDVGVGAGLQYVFPVTGALTDGFAGILPVFNVSLGLPF